MKKFNLLPFLFAVLIITAISGCSKDKDAEPSRSSLLTANAWQGSKVFVDGTDFTNFFDTQNTSMNFKTDGTYQVVFEGDADSGKWEFTSNEQKLLLDKGTSDELTVDILVLSSDKLNLKWIEKDDNNQDHTIEMHLIKK